MDDGARIAILAGGGLALWGLGWWVYRKLFGGPPPEDPTVGDGLFGNTPDD
jgi:hypothetical protein